MSQRDRQGSEQKALCATCKEAWILSSSPGGPGVKFKVGSEMSWFVCFFSSNKDLPQSVVLFLCMSETGFCL